MSRKVALVSTFFLLWHPLPYYYIRKCFIYQAELVHIYIVFYGPNVTLMVLISICSYIWVFTILYKSFDSIRHDYNGKSRGGACYPLWAESYKTLSDEKYSLPASTRYWARQTDHFHFNPMHMSSFKKCLVCCKIIIGTALSESLEPFEQEKGKTYKNLFWLE